MNSVLSSLTWGTWDEDEWALVTTAALKAEADDSAGCVPPFKVQQSRRKLRKKGLRAPRNSQLWFKELLERVESTSIGREKSIYHCNPLKCFHAAEGSQSETVKCISWADLPDGLHPRSGKLPAQRARNKQQQVDNLVVFLQHILRPGDVVVEFCAGSGYVALPLAYLYPQCTFVLLDMKEPSLAIAKDRIVAAKLTNVETFCGLIAEYHKPFDVGIALHACGEATDLVMEKCITERAAYVLAPCCVGKVKSSNLAYPRSATLAAELSRIEYEVLAKAADFGHSSSSAIAQTDTNRRRRRCKTLLESDRNVCAEEAQYNTFMFVMHPPTATPKNDVLVGVPHAFSIENQTAEVANRPFKLPCEDMLSTDSLVRQAMLST
uniref:Methyltransferase domain-containing protein n=1 Tax=Peronospora matthiolae TaxID=2874970 RepID=A0AAV1TZ77_9STRA